MVVPVVLAGETFSVLAACRWMHFPCFPCLDGQPSQKSIHFLHVLELPKVQKSQVVLTA